MENSFVKLLYRLGYAVIDQDNPEGIDVVASFYGSPIDPKPANQCSLLPPAFAPKGKTAFSLKRGDFTNNDVTELIEKFTIRNNSQNVAMGSLEGMIIATNFTKKESYIDSLLARNVYCWDGRRLMFYSAKARAIQNLASKGEVLELPVADFDNSSYLVATETSSTKNILSTQIIVFIDDHKRELILNSDHMEKILHCVYDVSLKKITESTKFEIQVSLTVHTLGIAKEKIVRNAYKSYADEKSLHPKVFFGAEPRIYQYGAAPWAILFSD